MSRKQRIVAGVLALAVSGVASAGLPTGPRDFLSLGQDDLQQQLDSLDLGRAVDGTRGR